MDAATIEKRVLFHESLEIMEVDFSGFMFKSTDDVKFVYGAIEKMLQTKQNKKWYFMVNYTQTKIQPEAWFQHALSGNLLNSEYSLGTVRINTDEPIKEALRRRDPDDDSYNPNAVSSTSEAADRIAEMRLNRTASVV